MSEPDRAREGIPRSRGGWGSRRIFGPLVMYHLLVLAGGFCTIYAISVGPRWLLVLGIPLIGLGLAVQWTIVAWSVGVAREAARTREEHPALYRSERRATGFLTSCVRCGWSGTSELGTCPRCGNPLVRRPQLVE